MKDPAIALINQWKRVRPVNRVTNPVDMRILVPRILA